MEAEQHGAHLLPLRRQRARLRIEDPDLGHTGRRSGPFGADGLAAAGNGGSLTASARRRTAGGVTTSFQSDLRHEVARKIVTRGNAA